MTEKNIKIDISSTLLEKSIDLAKNFLEKLLIPSIEETGLLMKEKVTFWRFKNQVIILNKAQEYCRKNNIKPKSISLKLLCPLIENSSLEDEEFLQNKWAVLLSNMIDSDQNIENHVFPFLLSQISKSEFISLEQLIFMTDEKLMKLNLELKEFKVFKENEELILKEKIQQIINSKDLNGKKNIVEIKNKLHDLTKKETIINNNIRKPEYLPNTVLQEFEIANLVRLGLIKSIPQHSAYSKKLEIRNNPDSKYLTIEDLEIEIENQGDVYIMTDLGNLFIKSCNDKK